MSIEPKTKITSAEQWNALPVGSVVNAHFTDAMRDDYIVVRTGMGAGASTSGWQFATEREWPQIFSWPHSEFTFLTNITALRPVPETRAAPLTVDLEIEAVLETRITVELDMVAYLEWLGTSVDSTALRREFIESGRSFSIEHDLDEWLPERWDAWRQTDMRILRARETKPTS